MVSDMDMNVGRLMHHSTLNLYLVSSPPNALLDDTFSRFEVDMIFVVGEYDSGWWMRTKMI